ISIGSSVPASSTKPHLGTQGGRFGRGEDSRNVSARERVRHEEARREGPPVGGVESAFHRRPASVSARRELVADGDSVASVEEQPVRRERGPLPHLAVDRLDRSELAKLIGGSLDEVNAAGLGCDEEDVARKEHLPMAETSALPSARTGLEVETREDAVVEPPDELLIDDEVRELRLEVAVPPKRLRSERRGQSVPIFRLDVEDLEKLTADAVAGR